MGVVVLTDGMVVAIGLVLTDTAPVPAAAANGADNDMESRNQSEMDVDLHELDGGEGQVG